MNLASSEPRAERDHDALLVRGIMLMAFIKGVMVGWVGLDPEAWYVWPWTWVAFGMMVPAISGWVAECRAGWNA